MLEIHPELLPRRVAALDGIDAVRAALAGTPGFLVGGSVRDLLLGAERGDIDVVVEGSVEEVANALGGPVRSHERFGTATVRLDGVELDLASARAESYRRPGALPEVRPASLADDLARRDFSINAMAWPLIGEESLIDPHAGLADLAGGVLRVLHERSIEDDPTRALRAARYAGRFGFELEPRTEELIRAADLETVSRERVESELRRIAAEPAARAGFELADAWGLVELRPGAGELIESVVAVFESEPWRSVADRGEAVLAAALERFGEEVRRLAHMDPARPSVGVAAARGRTGTELALARALGAEWLDTYVESWRHIRLEITGRDLLAAGIPEGPAIGRGLNSALTARLDGEATGRDEELAVALAAASAG
jgi:tRNA nucleotidyltransferase (CCA-adding enzyme)